MGWMSQVGNLLKQYTGGASSGAATGAAPALDVHEHFDQVAAAAPTSVMADGLAAAFRSDQTQPRAAQNLGQHRWVYRTHQVI